MDLIKTINDFLVIYNEHEILCNGFLNEPVVYYADYKLQKVQMPNSIELMVHKFDIGTRDFHKFCIIEYSSEVTPEYGAIHIMDNENNTVLYSFNNPLSIKIIKNYNGSLHKNFTKDEMFNIRLQYDIPFSDEELKEYFKLTNHVSKRAWIYYR